MQHRNIDDDDNDDDDDDHYDSLNDAHDCIMDNDDDDDYGDGDKCLLHLYDGTLIQKMQKERMASKVEKAMNR